MFEQFKVANFYIAAQAVLSLYATGRTTGIVCDCGQSMSHTVPIFEGYAMPHAVQRVALAGQALTDYLVRILTESKINLMAPSLFPVADAIKEQLCKVCRADMCAAMLLHGLRLTCALCVLHCTVCV
eukprot:TRINITY_DN628_c0_g1_i2.p6 TRINITY_DN628_c0_g1~~TRINITY_DN628_c0_g1_i2.p6  ORF type:complete len:127 (+),score=41.60 TRINITY_DN628_c0_g1_i2:578-958(+)